MTDQTEVLADVRRGMIPAHIYNDREMFAAGEGAAVRRGLGRSWRTNRRSPQARRLRRAPRAGRLVHRHPRREGEVRAQFNMCLHRGMQVCRAEMGNASHFRCPYHGWTYRNDGRLAGLPFHQDAYGGEDGFERKGQRAAAGAQPGDLQRADLRQPGPGRAAAGGVPRRLPRSTWTSTPSRAPAASSCAARSAGGSRPTGRSAPRTSPATCTTPRTPTPAWSRSACSASRRPRSARRARTYWAGAGGGTTYKLPAGRLRRAAALRRLPRRDDRPA